MKNLVIGQSGGPTAVINASLCGAVQAWKEAGQEGRVYGMLNGIEGFLADRVTDLTALTEEELKLLRLTPAAYLGSCRFKLPEDLTDAVYSAVFDNLREMNIGYFLYVGGNDSMDTIKKLSDYAIITGHPARFIGCPKTIDNDLWGTDKTFGFQSAVNIATNVLDCIHTTATSHGRVFVVELMGHKAGWLTLEAGIAGGADIILIPEIPYENKYIIRAIEKRNAAGKRFSILAVAEGAISKEDSLLTKKDLKAKLAHRKHPSISYQLAEELQTALGQEVRVTVPGHFQRGGSPCPFDRTLATRLGAAAAQLIIHKSYGNMVALKGTEIVPVPLEDVAGKLKAVPKDSDIVRAAREIGVSFGDC